MDHSIISTDYFNAEPDEDLVARYECRITCGCPEREHSYGVGYDVAEAKVRALAQHNYHRLMALKNADETPILVARPISPQVAA